MSDNTEQTTTPPIFEQPVVAEMPNVPPVPQKPENPLLQRIRLPGEIHQLPSGGIFYKNGELD
ncbi:MAG TPA: hypothetical protein ENK70_00230, partial [Methylophaga sp.]|nr:hypothetical protein [Methylophaga sp.]